MSINKTLSAQWISGKNKIKCTLPLIIFEEDNCIITFCPALDLSGYGSTESEANHSFEETLSEYFKYTVNKKTLAEDFKRIFNTHKFRKRNTTINIPEFA